MVTGKGLFHFEVRTASVCVCELVGIVQVSEGGGKREGGRERGRDGGRDAQRGMRGTYSLFYSIATLPS